MGETVKVDLKHPTGNFWMDNGIVVLHGIFGEGEFEIAEVLQSILDCLVQETGNEGEYFDAETMQIRKYNKKNWTYPANLFIKATPQAKKVKLGEKTYFTHPPIYNLKLSFKGRDICDVCGVINPLTDAKMWNFPFIVDPSKFGNFYPGVKRGMKLCPRCAVAGLAAYLGWLWRAQGRDTLHIFVFHSELCELDRLNREVFEPIRLEAGRGGNVEMAFYGPYIHETSLGLLLELFSHVHSSERLSEEGRNLLARLLGALEESNSAPLRLYAVTGAPGKAFNMNVLKEFARLHSFYRLYESWIKMLEVDDPYRVLVSVFRQFQTRQSNQYESIWRDKIAWAILEFGDPFPFIESFLFDVRAKEKNPGPLAWGTEEVFEYYGKEVLSMDTSLLKVLKGFGHALGGAAQNQNEMGLLYSLRNAKNPDEFFRVLNDAQFRLNLTVPEDLLQVEAGERIKGSPWMRVKTLLSIYAMNSYLWAGSTQSKKEEG